MPSGVQDALDAAIQDTQNNTKVPKTDLLNDSGLLQENNNTKIPKDLGGLNDDGA